MDDFIKTLLSLSVSGTVLYLLLWVFKPFYKNRFSKRWQYYIWLIAALRFVLPFTPCTTLVGSLFEKLPISDITTYGPIIQQPTDTLQAACGKAFDSYAVQNAFRLPHFLFYIWSALALVFLIRKITIYHEFLRYIKAGHIAISDIRILNLLSDCKEQLSIRTHVEVYQNPLIASPLMTGLFRPILILPTKELSDRSLHYIFTHELIHYRQKDLLYKWFIQFVICIHWFNPIVYLLAKEVNTSCELSCDELLIKDLDWRARREYGDTLLIFLKSMTQYNNSFASVTLSTGAEQIKERLGAIMHYQKKTKFIKTISMMAAILLSAGAFAIGAYAAQSVSPILSTGFVNHTVIQENGIFYIYCGEADINNKPISGVTEGSIGFVLVRKDGYTSITGFNNPKTLLNDVKDQCEALRQRETITEEEQNIILETVESYLSDLEHSVIYDSQGEIVGSYTAK